MSVFTCGHVIPPQNLQTLVVGKGPRGGELLFKYDQRDNQYMVGIYPVFLSRSPVLSTVHDGSHIRTDNRTRPSVI
jgi:hypothetical protein